MMHIKSLFFFTLLVVLTTGTLAAQNGVDYCVAAGANGTGADWISRVRLANLDHTSEQSGYSDFTDLNADLLIGSDQTLTINLNNAFPLDSVFAWIDYNTDGIFDNETELLTFGSIADLETTAGFSVPDTLSEKTTRMRVRVAFADPNPAMPCDSIFGEVEDYSVTFVTTVCQAGTPCDDGNPFTVGETLTEDCACSGGFTYPTYCNAQGSPGTGGDFITRVQVNTLDNPSEQSRYSNFTSLSTEVTIGSTHTISVTLNDVFELDSVFAWIDFNRDGTLDNDGELIDFSGVSVVDTQLVAMGTFTVPDDALPSITLLRVRVAFASPNDATPCGSIFGEVEDYALSILAEDCTPGAACDDANPFTVGETFSDNCSCSGGMPIDQQQFCEATGAPGTGGDWIRRVRLNGINNSSEQSSYSDFTDISTFLAKDDTYTLTVELNDAFPLDSVFAWIDYNRDTVFDNETELIVFSALENKTATAQVNVPQSTEPGLARLRVRVIYADPNPAEPCGSLFGEVEDYNVDIIEEGCIVGAPCDDGDPETTGETYDENCECTGGVVIREYCAAAGAAGTGADWISLVQLEEIDNASDQAGYTFFEDISTDLTIGEEYLMFVRLNLTFDLDSVFAWIDFNQDTIFDNDTERLVFSPIIDDLADAILTVPADAKLGQTRMRVRVAYADPNLPQPCGNIFGEVEDYHVFIVPDCSVGAACDDGNPDTTDEVFDESCRCQSPTSTNNQAEALRFDLFPNPAAATLNVQLHHQALTGRELKVTVTDLLGRKVQEHTVVAGNITLDLQQLPGGQLYLLSLEDASGKRFVKRFVKQ